MGFLNKLKVLNLFILACIDLYNLKSHKMEPLAFYILAFDQAFLVKEALKIQIYNSIFLEILPMVYDTIGFYKNLKYLVMDSRIMVFLSFYKVEIDLYKNSFLQMELKVLICFSKIIYKKYSNCF